MKSTGIVRKLDELGRITLPIELRRNLEIADKGEVEIFVDNETICLKKYIKNRKICKNCGTTENLKENNGLYICNTCLTNFK